MRIWCNETGLLCSDTGVIVCDTCPCADDEPIFDACDDCMDGLPAVLTATVIHQTTSLDGTCGDCDTFFASLVDVPLAHQGTIVYSSNTYHLWRSAEFDEADCGGVFDEHVISLLIRTINAGEPGQTCEALGFFHHIDDTTLTSTAFGYRIAWSNFSYFGVGNTEVCADTTFHMGAAGSADTSLNCDTIPFAEYDLRVTTG